MHQNGNKMRKSTQMHKSRTREQETRSKEGAQEKKAQMDRICLRNFKPQRLQEPAANAIPQFYLRYRISVPQFEDGNNNFRDELNIEAALDAVSQFQLRYRNFQFWGRNLGRIVDILVQV